MFFYCWIKKCPRFGYIIFFPVFSLLTKCYGSVAKGWRSWKKKILDIALRWMSCRVHGSQILQVYLTSHSEKKKKNYTLVHKKNYNFREKWWLSNFITAVISLIFVYFYLYQERERLSYKQKTVSARIIDNAYGIIIYCPRGPKVRRVIDNISTLQTDWFTTEMSLKHAGVIHTDSKAATPTPLTNLIELHP